MFEYSYNLTHRYDYYSVFLFFWNKPQEDIINEEKVKIYMIFFFFFDTATPQSKAHCVNSQQPYFSYASGYLQHSFSFSFIAGPSLYICFFSFFLNSPFSNSGKIRKKDSFTYIYIIRFFRFKRPS